MRTSVLSAWLLAALPAVASAQEAGNLLGDPFVQVTAAMAACPVPRGPYVTADSVRRAAHGRTQMGGSCYRVGRCRLPNAYLYDREIIPRVSLYIREDGRFADTSVWVVGAARMVTLMGCVQSKEQADALQQAVALVDDVLGVANLLMVGTQGPPPYRLVGDTTPDF
ncbi:BON domain-containing protein [Ramlibacter tataouinensis]|uniref:Transporter n=1 Tax=Ramlibacter tataouinensis TaxID=94132 RepID=A0A127JQ17_9BURK|nr:BON domain-containing protein [Ramlibacter tataouinensis]AMO22015.1 transporter [Ramlibacter tataouinensis]